MVEDLGMAGGKCWWQADLMRAKASLPALKNGHGFDRHMALLSLSYDLSFFFLIATHPFPLAGSLHF